MKIPVEFVCFLSDEYVIDNPITLFFVKIDPSAMNNGIMQPLVTVMFGIPEIIFISGFPFVDFWVGIITKNPDPFNFRDFLIVHHDRVVRSCPAKFIPCINVRRIDIGARVCYECFVMGEKLKTQGVVVTVAYIRIFPLSDVAAVCDQIKAVFSHHVKTAIRECLGLGSRLINSNGIVFVKPLLTQQPECLLMKTACRFLEITSPK